MLYESWEYYPGGINSLSEEGVEYSMAGCVGCAQLSRKTQSHLVTRSVANHAMDVAVSSTYHEALLSKSDLPPPTGYLLPV